MEDEGIVVVQRKTQYEVPLMVALDTSHDDFGAKLQGQILVLPTCSRIIILPPFGYPCITDAYQQILPSAMWITFLTHG